MTTTYVNELPAGYTLPKAAAELLADVEAHGWLAVVRWFHDDSDDPTFETHVTIQLGRKVQEEEADRVYTGFYRGPRWTYKLTWHNRGLNPGRLRLFGQGIAETPNNPAPHYGPSVKGIRQTIAAWPLPAHAGTKLEGAA